MAGNPGDDFESLARRYWAAWGDALRATVPGTGAGAGTGAHFIGYFARPETPWAHLDIANMAFGAANDVKPAGSAGYSVRLLERFVRDFQPVAKEKGAGGY